MRRKSRPTCALTLQSGMGSGSNAWLEIELRSHRRRLCVVTLSNCRGLALFCLMLSSSAFSSRVSSHRPHFACSSCAWCRSCDLRLLSAELGSAAHCLMYCEIAGARYLSSNFPSLTSLGHTIVCSSSLSEYPISAVVSQICAGCASASALRWSSSRIVLMGTRISPLS